MRAAHALRVTALLFPLLLAPPTALLAGSAAAHVVTLDTSYVSSIADDQVDDQVEVIEEVSGGVALPYSYVASFSDGAASTDSVTTLTNESFDFTCDHVRLTPFNSKGWTFTTYIFSVDVDTPYALSGAYTAVDTSGRLTILDVYLRDTTDAVYAFRNRQVSNNTPNESFTLGLAEGDGSNILSGSLTGTLLAGHVYHLKVNMWINSNPAGATSGATASGWLNFDIGSTACGNGAVESGEDCDDGNTVGGDCCSATCGFEPLFTVCDDGNFCTTGELCDGVGACSFGLQPTDCDDGNSCTLDTCDSGLATCENDAIGACSSQTGADPVAAGSGTMASVLGGPTSAGGLGATFDSTGGGSLSAELATVPAADLLGFYGSSAAYSQVNFVLPLVDPYLFWDIEYSGSFTGLLTLTFGYDEAAIPAPYTESNLAIYHYVEPSPGCLQGIDCAWLALTVTGRDLLANTLTVVTDSLSPFSVGLVLPAEAVVSSWTLSGTAAGGSVDFDLGGQPFQIVTSTGETADEVVAAIAAAINADALLVAGGVSASAVGATLDVSGAISNAALSDAGLSGTLTPPPVPFASPLGSVVLSLLLVLAAAAAHRIGRAA